MHLLVTDRMTCPRCGPAFGLILRADRMQERRVLEGGLGCPNCREVYPVSGGAADLRPPPREELAPEAMAEAGAEEVEMAHALLGVVEGPGEVLAAGLAARFASSLARRIPGLEVVAAHSADPGGDEEPGVSRLVFGERFPFTDRSLRGVLLEGPKSASLLREAARVLAPGGRVVVLAAPEGAPGRLMASGLTLNLDQDGVVVAGR